MLLTPGKTDNAIHYTLFIEWEIEISLIAELGEKFETELCANYYYHQARFAGQLSKLRVFQIKENGHEKFISRKVNDGQRLGDIKPKFIDFQTDWTHYFKGHYIN
mgnify:CR=1 FL=1